MKKGAKVFLVIAIALVLAVLAAVVIIGTGVFDRPLGSSGAESGVQSSSLAESSSLPAEPSVPQPESKTELESAPQTQQPEPPPAAGNGELDEADFVEYLERMGLYIMRPIQSEADFLSGEDGDEWGIVMWLVTETYKHDVANGVQYSTNQYSEHVVPLERLAEACRELYVYDYDFTLLENNSVFGKDVQNGGIPGDMAYGFGPVYLEVNAGTLRYEDGRIVVECNRIDHGYDEQEATILNQLVYTFNYKPENAITPYQLVSIEDVSTVGG